MKKGTTAEERRDLRAKEQEDHKRKGGSMKEERTYFQNLEEIPKLKRLNKDEPIFYHSSECKCESCKKKGGTMTNNEIREKLGLGWDKITFKQDSRDGMIHKGDVYVDKGYFYRHGMTPDALCDKVLKIFPDAKIIDSGDHWGNWPSRSYMYVIFRLPKEDK